jgi:ATP synthase protein I
VFVSAVGRPNPGGAMIDLGEKGTRYRQVALLGAIPMVLLAGPLIGFFIGSYLDRWLGSSPWLMIVFALLGAIAAVRQTMNLLSKANEADRKNRG